MNTMEYLKKILMKIIANVITSPSPHLFTKHCQIPLKSQSMKQIWFFPFHHFPLHTYPYITYP